MRRHTWRVKVGNMVIGGDACVAVQSMANVSTMETDAAVAQTLALAEAGAELVRFTAQGVREAENLRVIKERVRQAGCDVPLVADIHFNHEAALRAAHYVEKVRINPGNFAPTLEEAEARLIKLITICKEHGTALRIGVNHGSLAERIMERYGDTPQGMVASGMEFLRICHREGFDQVVVSIKASNTIVMIETTRLMAATMDGEGLHYPLHLGVTEAGDGEDGRIKSAVGIGALLVDGIGDTIRVSLSEDPVAEIPVALSILQAARVRISKTEYISCPGCGRTLFDLQGTIAHVKRATNHLKHLKIGIMGCIVNGPGEMADADYGYVGAGPGRISLYKSKECLRRNIPEAEAVEELVGIIKANGDWREPNDASAVRKE